jgi:transposase
VTSTTNKPITRAELEGLYNEIEQRVAGKFESRIERLEKEVDEQKELARIWKQRYFREQEITTELRGALSLSFAEVKELKAVIKKQQKQIENQKSEIIKLKKALYGRRSEASKPLASPENPPEKRARGRQYGAKGHGRKKHPHLPRREQVLEFSESENVCEICGLEFEVVGSKSSEEIDVQIVVEIVTTTRKTIRSTCKCKGVHVIKTPPAPLKLFRGSAYSLNFWSYAIFEKYHLQRPLSRICKQLEAHGLELSSSVLVNGLKKLHHDGVFKALVEDIASRVRSATHQMKDETGWKIFQEIEGKNGYQHWMWVTRTKDCCLFEIDASRSREVAQRTIGDGPLIVTSDMLKVYKNLGPNVTNSWCWSHVRRYVLALSTRPKMKKVSDSWVKRIDWLYHCNNSRLASNDEKQYKHNDDALRAEMAEFERQAKSYAKRAKDPEAKRVFKMIAQHWDGLAVFLDYPQVPMDNNLSEQALRNLVVGRKCFYGSGALWSGQLAADLTTIFTTLEINGINPQVWLREYLTAVAKNGGRAPPNSTDFLPWNTPPSNLLLD